MTPLHYWILGAAIVIAAPFVLYAVCRVLFPPFERSDETHEVTTEDGWTIRLFRHLPRAESPRHPVLLCHGAFANHHNFDIPTGTSLADYLAAEGYDVWLMDFRGDRSATPAPGRSRSSATADEYLLEDLPAAIDYILGETGCTSVHAVGHSMGAMFLTAYAIEFEGYGLASLSTIGMPVTFEGLRHHPHPVLIGMIGAFPWLAEPVQRMLCSLVVMLRLRSRAYPMNFANCPAGAGPREGFHKADLLPAPVANSLDTWAAKGEWLMVDGEMDVLEEMANVRVPWQMICARGDLLTPSEHIENTAAKLPVDLIRTSFFSVEDGHAIDFDHIDLVIGTHAPAAVFPALVEWFVLNPASGRPTVEMKIAEEPAVEPEVEIDDTEAIAVALSDAADIEAPEEVEVATVRARPRRAAAAAETPSEGEGDEFEVVQRRRHGRVMDRIRLALDGVASEDELRPAELPGSSIDDLDRAIEKQMKKTAAKKKKASAKSKAKAKPKAKAKAPAKKKAAAKPKAKAPAKKKSAAKKKAAAPKKKTAAKKKPAAKKKGG